MAVQSEELKNGERVPRGGFAPPLSRQYLDTSRRPGRVLLGLLFVAYSAIGTVIGVRADIAPALDGRADAALLSLGIGLAVAFLIFIAELLLAEVSLFWYCIPLAPDVYYTYHFSGWIGAIIRSKVQGGDQRSLTVVIFFVTVVFAVLVAYFGERLLFGRRRR